MSNKYVRGAVAAKILGVSQGTLRNYEKQGKINVIRNPGNQRLYDVLEYQLKNGLITEDQINEDQLINKHVCVCYCRVSTYDQKQDLERQVEYMKNKYPRYEMITDIASGINFNRKGLKKIIDYAIEGRLETLVVSYKDRLCRIGYELIEFILTKYSDTVIIIDAEDGEEKEDINQEIANDVLEIMTVYSTKIHGMRRYKNKNS